MNQHQRHVRTRPTGSTTSLIPTRSKRLAAVALTATALVTLACRVRPPTLVPAPTIVPPATTPVTTPPPPTSPPEPPQGQGGSVTCEPAAPAVQQSAYTPDILDSTEAGTAAMHAVADATIAGESTDIEITTLVGGRPQFDTMPAEKIGAALASETEPVIAVDDVQRVSVTGNTTNDPLHSSQWSDSLTPYSPAWACGTGQGVDIAIVDTGVDGNHPDLGARVTSGASALSGTGSVTPGTGAADSNGHGTHVAGIAAASAGNGIGVAGVAPDAGLIPVRVLGADGSGSSTDVAAGVVWAVDDGAEVINMSLGSTAESASIDSAVAYAATRGVVVVAAGGNGGAGGFANYPAAGDHTIAVASCTSSGSISSFSTRGGYLDVTAPGSSIISTLPGGGYGTKSGTSMATPFVAGVVALMLAAHPTLHPDQVLARLTSTATDAGTPGFDTTFGYGLVNPVGAVSSP